MGDGFLFDEFCEDENATFVLTEQACMKEALSDFGIDVSIHMAEAIKNRFLELMLNYKHIRKE